MSPQLLKAQHPYEHPYGDLIYGPYGNVDYADYLRKYEQVELQDLNMLKLAYVKQDTWKALAELNMQQWWLKKLTMYTCSYTDYEHAALVPLAIFSNDLEKYFTHFDDKPWYQEIACDKTWNCGEDGAHLEKFGSRNALTEFQRVIIGPGYTYNINDGNSSVNPVVIDIDNGDKLGCATLVWHNK